MTPLSFTQCTAATFGWKYVGRWMLCKKQSVTNYSHQEDQVQIQLLKARLQ